jgi:hypothetical protein
MTEWQNGGVAGWRNGVIYPAIFTVIVNDRYLRRMAEWRNGEMAEWWNDYIPNLPDIFTMTPTKTMTLTTTPTPFHLLYI